MFVKKMKKRRIFSINWRIVPFSNYFFARLCSNLYFCNV